MIIGLLRRGTLHLLWSLAAIVSIPLPGCAEQLPVKHYTTADGLPRDAASHIEQDSRGFIWIVAGDGISRFDGHKFTNYTTDDGLPDNRVNDFLETRLGVYWIATEEGLCRFNPTGDRRKNSDDPMFVVYNPSNSQSPIAFNALLEDERGAIWCATAAGVFRLEVSTDGQAQFHLIDLGTPKDREKEKNATALLIDHKKFLWIGTWGGAIYRLAPDGRAERYAGEHGLPSVLPGDDSWAVNVLFQDREGRIWLGTRGTGLHKLVAEPGPMRPLYERTYSTNDGLPTAWITSMRQTRDGKLWVATIRGLCLATPAGDGRTLSFQIYDEKKGLCDREIEDVIEDRGGNLWVASRCSAMRIARNGFTGYGPSDGLTHAFNNSIFESRDGELIVISRDESMNHRRIISRFDGTRFSSIAPNLPPNIAYHGWGWWQTIMQDHAGEWWVPTGGDALFRFPRAERLEQLDSSRPKAVFTRREGLPGTEVFRVYEDARGDVWLGVTGYSYGLVRWDRATSSLHDHTPETGVPSRTDFTGFNDLMGICGSGRARAADCCATAMASSNASPSRMAYHQLDHLKARGPTRTPVDRKSTRRVESH